MSVGVCARARACVCHKGTKPETPARQVRPSLIPVNLNVLRLLRLGRALPLLASNRELGSVGDAAREATRILRVSVIGRKRVGGGGLQAGARA
jgi:hypothetical protein